MNKFGDFYAPHISDPDPPEPPMSDEEMREAAKKAHEFMERKRWREEAAKRRSK
jgi:hypothetical protein